MRQDRKPSGAASPPAGAERARRRRAVSITIGLTAVQRKDDRTPSAGHGTSSGGNVHCGPGRRRDVALMRCVGQSSACRGIAASERGSQTKGRRSLCIRTLGFVSKRCKNVSQTALEKLGRRVTSTSLNCSSNVRCSRESWSSETWQTVCLRVTWRRMLPCCRPLAEIGLRRSRGHRPARRARRTSKGMRRMRMADHRPARRISAPGSGIARQSTTC